MVTETYLIPGLRTRVLRSVATTKQLAHSLTFSFWNNSPTRTVRLFRLGERRRTSKIPWCEPGANRRKSEKSKSWVIRNLDSFCAASQISLSGWPASRSAYAVWTSWPRSSSTVASRRGRFSSNLTFIEYVEQLERADPLPPKPRQRQWQLERHPISPASKRMTFKLPLPLPRLRRKRICPFQLFHIFDEDQVGRKPAPPTCDRTGRPWPRRPHRICRATRWPSRQRNLGRGAEGIKIPDYPGLGFLGLAAVGPWFTPGDLTRTSALSKSEKPNRTGRRIVPKRERQRMGQLFRCRHRAQDSSAQARDQIGFRYHVGQLCFRRRESHD